MSGNPDIPEEEALPMLVWALENLIDKMQDRMLRQGLTSDRDKIRERILHPDNRFVLLPKPAADEAREEQASGWRVA